MMRPPAIGILCVAMIGAVHGCASTPSPSTGGSTSQPNGEKRVISQRRALDLIGSALDNEGVDYRAKWKVDIGAEEPLEADIRLAGTQYGLEWVSPQDRADLGDTLPKPDSDEQLRLMSGSGDDARAQILVLDHTTYQYSPDPTMVQRGTTGIRSAESRLRRDVTDFVVYVRGQGAL